MTSCDKIRDILMTSYIDNELDEISREKVESHLSVCPECARIKTLLSEDIIAPLEKSGLIQPSGKVWASIAQEIGEPVQAQETEPLLEKIRRMVFRPVPAAAVSFLFVGLMIVSVFRTTGTSRLDPVVENYFSKHFRFLDYLESNGAEFYTDNDHLGFISPIEKYLF